ncbi:hypothetical protein ACLOJK_003427 [Asimina triloba]
MRISTYPRTCTDLLNPRVKKFPSAFSQFSVVTRVTQSRLGSELQQHRSKHDALTSARRHRPIGSSTPPHVATTSRYSLQFPLPTPSLTIIHSADGPDLTDSSGREMHTSSSSSSSSAAADHRLGLEREIGKTDSLLHSIRKPAAAPKPWKKPIAGPPPTRVYVVDPHGFRQLVQKLTGAPQQQHPPPPLPPQQQQQQLGYSHGIQGSNTSAGGSPHQLQLFFSSEATTKSNGGGNLNLMPAETSQFMFPPPPPTSYPLLSAASGAVSLLDQYTTLF